MTDPVVDTDWLAARLSMGGLVILDATWFLPGEPRNARDEYAARHIPGAVFFDIDRIADRRSPLPHMLPEARSFATEARRLGVSRQSTVVAYDALGLFSAPRVWWSFRAMGHERVFVLDGGLPKWIAEGRPLEAGWPAVAHGDFKAQFQPGLARALTQMRRIVAQGGEQIVDARPAGRFSGATPEPRPGLRSGHMPHARNVPASDLVDEHGELKTRVALAARFKAAGVDLARPIVTTCGSGITAAVAALALARIGRNDVALYDGSWAEWAALPDTKVAVGEAAGGAD